MASGPSRNYLSRASKRRNPNSSADLTVTVADTGNALTNGTNLQTAIDNAAFGDTIVLQAGAIYQAPASNTFLLRNKGAGSSAITITTHKLSTLAAAGRRIVPATHSSSLAICKGNGLGVFTTETGAHHYTFVGLDCVDGGTGSTANIIMFIGGDVTCHDMTVDRCFVHCAQCTVADPFPTTTTRTSGRGVWAEGYNTVVKNSYIAGFADGSSGSATYGVIVSVGPGPLTITNNYIEAWFSGIFLGGADPDTTHTATLTVGATTTVGVFSSVSGLAIGDYVALYLNAPYVFPKMTTQWATVRVTNIVGTTVTYVGEGPTGLPEAPAAPGAARWNGSTISNVTIQYNTVYKVVGHEAIFPGGCKNYIEIKMVDGCLIDGNILDGERCSGIAGTIRNQGGSAPWVTLNDVTITNNLLRHGQNIAYALLDDQATSTPGDNFQFLNNLMLDVNNRFFVGAGGTNVSILHNTLRNTTGYGPGINAGPASVLYGQQWGTTNFQFKDNICDYGNDGWVNVSGNPDSDAWPPAGIIDLNNVVINNMSQSPLHNFDNSFEVANDAAVGFTNSSSADAGGDYHGLLLTSGSDFHAGNTSDASDGTDVGVNFTTLDAALAHNDGWTGV